VLSLQKLTLFRQERLLFADLDFCIAAGDIVQVKGPNGAGKSSLLRVIAGIVLPNAGNVRFNADISESIDVDIFKEPEVFHQHLLYIGHLPGIKAELTARENLSLMLSLHGHSCDVQELDELLDIVGLLGFEDMQAGHLSAGQQRRIALARLWSRPSPNLWILDEPFTAIDYQGVAQLEERILAHADNGGSVIFTTHQAHSFTDERIKTITLDYNLE
jgi:heme exporter protein A